MILSLILTIPMTRETFKSILRIWFRDSSLLKVWNPFKSLESDKYSKVKKSTTKRKKWNSIWICKINSCSWLQFLRSSFLGVSIYSDLLFITDSGIIKFVYNFSFFIRPKRNPTLFIQSLTKDSNSYRGIKSCRPLSTKPRERKWAFQTGGIITDQRIPTRSFFLPRTSSKWK